jgi:hypothetical protein
VIVEIHERAALLLMFSLGALFGSGFTLALMASVYRGDLDRMLVDILRFWRVVRSVLWYRGN